MYNRQSWPQEMILNSQSPDNDYIVISGKYLAGEIPLNGAGTSNGTYLNGIPSFITITSDADDSTTNFTFVLKDVANRRYTFTVAGPDTATSDPIEIPVYLIESISIDQDSVGNLTIGISDETATPWSPLDQNRTEFNDAIAVDLSAGATLNYTVEYTNSDALRSYPWIVLDDQTLANETTSGQAAIPTTVFYVRTRYNSWTDGYTTTQVVTSGAYGSWKNY